MERREVTIYARTGNESSPSVPLQAVANGDGTYSLSMSVNTLIAQGVSLTDHSGQIGAASTSQQVMAANPNRKYLLVQNVSDTDMWVNFGGDATEDQPSILLPADGGNITESSPSITDSVHIICGTISKSFTAKEG
jgi:hypothetical protein